MNPGSLDPSGPLPSFKTNVNRAKTKRWVEAKSYSYDGDDWAAADDFDEYGGYEEEPQHKPTGLRQQGQQGPMAPHPAPDRREGYGPPQPGDHYSGPPQAPYQQGGRDRGNSFGRGDDRRAFSGPPGHPGMSPIRTAYGPSPGMGNPNNQRIQGPYGQQPYPYPNQPRRPSLENQGRPGMPGPGYRGYPNQPRHSAEGSRTHSMTSNTSNDYHGRREFSNPAAVPQPLHPTSRPPRKSSLGQSDAPQDLGATDIVQSPVADNTSAQLPETQETRDRSDSSTTPRAFVRPADIYKRLQEERDKERQSQESARPSMDAILGTNRRDDSPSKSGDDSETSRRRKQTLDTVAERKSEYGMEGIIASSKAQQPQKKQNLLPEISGFGEGFGEDFLGSMGSQNAPARRPEPSQSEAKAQERQNTLTVPIDEPSKNPANADLQHQPSLGFRSVVNQAFDQQIPQTPSSTSGSNVGRSNSESTSGISPIISREPSTAAPRQKESREDIPSIAEEPTPGTPRPLSLEGPETPIVNAPELPTKPPGTPPPKFIPGHRRNLSTPSPDNSPARTPAVEGSRQLLEPQEAEIGMTTPTSTTQSISSASNTRHEAVDHGIAPPPVEDPKVITSDRALANSRPTTPGSRAGSPTKGRVRDLAEKIESANSSRRGSDSSLRDKLNETTPVQRPLGDRTESFRPQLPGAWASYTTNVQTPPVPTAEKSLLSRDFPATNTSSAVASTSSSVTGNKTRPEETEEALKRDHAITEPQADTHATSLHSDSLSPHLNAPGDAESSIVPTPMELKSPEHGESEYFAPIEPLKHRSRKSSASDLPRLAKTEELDGMSTENSPSDLESDRLRKQLVRELSPQVEHFDESAIGQAAPQPDSRSSSPPAMKASIDNHESMLFPSEYESYWNDDDAMSGKGVENATQLPAELATDDVNTSHTLQPPLEGPPPFESAPKVDTIESLTQVPITAVDEPHGQQPELSRRFSWEQVSEDMGPSQSVQPLIPQESQSRDLHNAFSSTPPQLNTPDPYAHPETANTNSSVDIEGPAGLDKRDSPPASSHALVADKPLPPVVPSDNQKIPAFREILALKSADERIKTYNSTREQFANMNTGLANWIMVTVDGLPEHRELLTNGGNFGTHRVNTSSKMASGSTSDQPYLSAPGNAGTSSTGQWKMGSSPSGGKLSSQQVQSKGKDLLHSAGIFGGKANKTAKGIFAKGRSKFRSSGGGDKAVPKPSPATSNTELSTHNERKGPIGASSTISVHDQAVTSTAATVPRKLSLDKQLPAIAAESPPPRPISPLSTINTQDNESANDVTTGSPNPPTRTGLAFQGRLTVHQSQMEPFEAATFPQDLVIPPQYANPPTPAQAIPKAPIADEFLKATSPYRTPSPLYNSPSPGSEHRTPTQADFNPSSYTKPDANSTPKLAGGSSFHNLPQSHADRNAANRSAAVVENGSRTRDMDERSNRGRDGSRSQSQGRPSRRSTAFSFIGFQDTTSEDLALHTPTTPEGYSVQREDAGNTPLRYGIEHDFISSNQATPERNRRQSSYQDEATSSHYQHHPSRDSINPRHSSTEFEIRGVGPPSEDDVSARKRTNRLSATWKSLTSSSKSDYGTPPSQPKNDYQSSGLESPTSEKRKKRRSFFGGGGTHGITANSRDHTERHDHHQTPPRASTDPLDRAQSSHRFQNQASHKPQRSTTSVMPTPEQGKKKRLSSLGNLFGRSSNKKTVAVIGTPQSAFTPPAQPQSQQHPYAHQFHPQHSFQHGQPYNYPPQSYQHSPNPGYNMPYLQQQSSPYDNTPLEGYYSPERDESTNFSPGFMSGQRSSSMTHPVHRPPQTEPTYPSTSHPAPSNMYPPQAYQYPTTNNQPPIAPTPPHHSQRVYEPPAYHDNNSSIPRSAPRSAPRPGSGTFTPSDAGDPPPPPPKDHVYTSPPPLIKPETPRHRRQVPSGSSQATQEQKRQTRQSLPLLQTSSIAPSTEHSRATKSAILTPEEARKARQWEIESSGKLDKPEPSKSPRRSRKDESEEKIVMSSTAYPGQEWNPGYGWDGD